MADLISELRERRVLPAVGVYVASCWVVVEILDRLVERYLLSPYLTDIVFWGLYSLIPAVVLVAWSYGRPGKDTATTAQKVGVPINLIATAGLLFTVFGGKDLGATAEVVSFVNEAGEQETVVVPEESYRRRLFVFFYENDSGDSELDWLQYAATELLTQDLQQDPYVLASSPYSNWGGDQYARLKAAGFQDGVGAPASLLRDITLDANRQYFTEGSLAREGEELVLTTVLWEAAGMTRVAEITERGWDLYDMMDRASVAVREAMEVPTVGVKGHEDLPLAETYGESEQALRDYVEGLNRRLIDNDSEAAIERFDAALESDAGFVLAHFVKALILVQGGNLPAAGEVLAEAQRYDYRLPANDRASLKGLYYRATDQTDKLMAFLRLQAQHRDDGASHFQLATLLMVNGELDEAKKHFELALQRDASDKAVYLTLSDLARSQGDLEGAIDFARRYQEARPEDMAASLKLGDLLRDTGALDEAEDHYQRAQIMDDAAVSPVLNLHVIAARRGDDERARALLEEALVTARTASQLAEVHMIAHYFEARLGRIDAAIEQLRAAEPYLAESTVPFNVALTIYSSITSLHLRRGDVESAKAALAEARSLVPEPPLNQFLEPIAATIAAFEGDFSEAQTHLDNFEALLDAMGFQGLAFQIPLLASEIAYRAEDYALAATQMQAGIDQIERSFIAGALNTHGMPLLLAQLAWLQVNAGQLESAESTLEQGFRIDPSLPNLWVARAGLQKARGQDPLARASVDYALAIWKDADPELHELLAARRLAEEIGEGGP